MRKYLILLLVLLISLVGFANPSAKPAKDGLQLDVTKNGWHNGEVKQLEVDISFYGQYGHTVTDRNGTFYYFFGYCFYEPKVYPPEYWGVFPLYFFDTSTGIKIATTNKGPRNRAKLTIRTQAYCLNTDGSNGAELLAPTDQDIDVDVGETEVVDASFVSRFVEGADSGLDRLVVKVLHPNEGGGPGNADPALIMVKEAVFCPPESEGAILDVLNEVLGQ